MSIAYYNGEFSDYEKVRIPLSDRAIFFGDGIYEACIGYKDKIYLEEEHLERFFNNIIKLNMPFSKTKSQLSDILHLLCEKNGYEKFFLYFQLTRNSPIREHGSYLKDKFNLLITLKEFSLPVYENGFNTICLPDNRYGMCNIKTINLLPNVIASIDAHDSGCQEVIFLKDGYVTECAHSNISIVRDNVIYTHPKDNRILPGITRDRMLYFAKKIGIKYQEKAFGYVEMISADEVIVSSTSKFLQKVDSIDSVKLKDKKENSVCDKIFKLMYEEYLN